MPAIRDTAAAVESQTRHGFRTRQVETVVTVGIVPAVLVPNHPDRIFLQVILEGVNSVFIGRDGKVTVNSGVPLLTQWDQASWTPERDAEGTSYERWAVANAAPSNVRVIETIRRRDA